MLTYPKRHATRRLVALAGVALATVALPGAVPSADRSVIPFPTPRRPVPPEVLQRVYQEVRTPFKYGIVLRDADGAAIDCPSVFRHANRWFMLYIRMNKVGYETHLAESPDLLHWTPKGRILSFRDGTWDAFQAAGYIALQDATWGGSHRLRRFAGRYWLSYLGGALQGYETDPLAIGIAWTRTPHRATEWTRLEGPVLSRDQPDVRAFESLTQYKSTILRDPSQSLGYPFVMFYNGKPADGVERIGMAVSRDLRHWQRFGDGPVIDHGKGISGDPQVVRLRDVWVMFHFGAFWKPKAFDTFACSYDLAHWTPWDGPHLVEPSEDWDREYAHKPWVVKHRGVVYHFYCAVGSQGRLIALATSRDLKTAAPKRRSRRNRRTPRLRARRSASPGHSSRGCGRPPPAR